MFLDSSILIRVFGFVGVYTERISGFPTVHTRWQLRKHSSWWQVNRLPRHRETKCRKQKGRVSEIIWSFLSTLLLPIVSCRTSHLFLSYSESSTFLSRHRRFLRSITVWRTSTLLASIILLSEEYGITHYKWLPWPVTEWGNQWPPSIVINVTTTGILISNLQSFLRQIQST